MSGNILSFPRFKAIDGNGVPLRGGLLYTYVVGSTTAKASYSDAGCTTANTNPVVLDSNGEAQVYMSGAYKMNLKTSAGAQVPGWPIDNIEASEYLSAYSYPTASATDQGVTGDSNTIKYHVDTIGSKNGTIFLKHDSGSTTTTYTLTTSESIPANISLEIEKGAVLNGAGTLTFNNVGQIKAQSYQQIFGSSLTVSFTKAGDIYPGWRGITGDDSTDNYTALTQLISDAPIGSKIKFPGGIFRFSDTWTISKSLIIEGSGWDGSAGGTLLKSTKGSGNAIHTTGSNVILRDFELTQTGSVAVGIYNAGGQNTYDHLLIYPGGTNGFTTAGIKEQIASANILTTVKNCYIGGNAIGWEVSRGNVFVSDNNYFAFNDVNIRVGHDNYVTSFWCKNTTAEVKDSNGNTAVDIYIEKASNLIINDSYFETSWDATGPNTGQLAIKCDIINGGEIRGNYINGNSISLYAIHFTANTVKNVIVDGNTFIGQVTNDINLNGASCELGNNYTDGTITSAYTWLYSQKDFVDQSGVNILGLSAGSTPARNLRGSEVFTGADTQKVVVFAHEESNTSYYVLAQVVAVSDVTPAAGSTRCWVDDKATTGFSINLEVAPGGADTITVDWMILR